MRASHSAAERGAQVLVIAVALLTWVGGALVPAAAAAQAAAPADVRTGSPVGEAARPGVVRGVVYDSSAGVPLAGAVVQLAPADRSTERVISVLADSSGRFQADGLAAGVWVVGFSHAALDAYGFDMPSGTVEVAAGDSVTVTLGLPGVRGLYRAVCGAPAAVGDPVAGLLGVVRDADTDVPAAGAQLSIAWSALEVANGVRLVPRRVTVATEADGTFSACGLPADVALAVRLESGPGADSTWTSGDLEVTVPPGTLARLTVTAGRAVLASGEAARDSAAGAGVAAAGPALAGEARLLGTVVDPQGAPVANARIAVLDAGREGGDGRAGCVRARRATERHLDGGGAGARVHPNTHARGSEPHPTSACGGGAQHSRVHPERGGRDGANGGAHASPRRATRADASQRAAHHGGGAGPSAAEPPHRRPAHGAGSSGRAGVRQWA
jgi:hypothetical protein